MLSNSDRNKLEMYRLKNRVIMIKNAFNCVPKDIAPNEDKGIYFAKAMKDLDDLIEDLKSKLEEK